MLLSSGTFGPAVAWADAVAGPMREPTPARQHPARMKARYRFLGVMTGANLHRRPRGGNTGPRGPCPGEIQRQRLTASMARAYDTDHGLRLGARHEIDLEGCGTRCP